MSKSKPKTADLITAFTSELEEKFSQLEALERRLKETENNIFDSQEKLLRSIRKVRTEIQNTEIDIDLEPANQWEIDFQNNLNQGIERLKEEFKLSSNKLSIFYKSIGIVGDRKSTRLNSSHVAISYAVFCLYINKKTQA